MKYAVSDVGTNSCRLLVAEIGSSESLKTIEKKVVTTRVGEGLEKTGWLKPDAIHRTLLCLSVFCEEVHIMGLDNLRVAATSAVRDAKNRQDFVALAEGLIGLKVEVLSGEKEGELSFLGAQAGLSLKRSPLVVDVGGGSTEIIFRSRGIHAVSIPVGAVRATESGWNEDEIKRRLTEGMEPRVKTLRAPLVLVGGTSTSMVAIKKGLKVYDPGQVQGEKLLLSDIKYIYDRLVQMSEAERRRVAGLQPERADIIVKGILIIKCLMEIMGRRQALVSDSDLLDGLVWDSLMEG